MVVRMAQKEQQEIAFSSFSLWAQLHWVWFFALEVGSKQSSFLSGRSGKINMAVAWMYPPRPSKEKELPQARVHL